jgi:hypothetical protein
VKLICRKFKVIVSVPVEIISIVHEWLHYSKLIITANKLLRDNLITEYERIQIYRKFNKLNLDIVLSGIFRQTHLGSGDDWEIYED